MHNRQDIAGNRPVLVCERPWQMITATDKHGLSRTTFSPCQSVNVRGKKTTATDKHGHEFYIGGAASRRTIMRSVPPCMLARDILFACLHGGTPCLLRSRSGRTQRKQSNISLGMGQARQLQRMLASVSMHRMHAPPFKTVYSPPFGGRGLGVGLYFIFHSSTVNLSMSKLTPTSTTRRPSVR